MSLAITYAELRRRIGRYLDIGRDTAGWETVDVDDVADILRNGLRRVYFAGDESGRYVWSFLRTSATLAMVAGTSTYDLPSDFGGMASEGFVVGKQGELRVMELSEEKSRTLLTSRNQSGTPKYWAIRAKATVAGTTTRYEVAFYPTPDAAITLSYRYVKIPSDIDGTTNIYPMGAEMHSQTILAAVLAEAEETLNDPDAPGVQATMFAKLLAQSMQIDRDGFGFTS